MRRRGRAAVIRAVLSPAAERDILAIIEWIAAVNTDFSVMERT